MHPKCNQWFSPYMRCSYRSSVMKRAEGFEPSMFFHISLARKGTASRSRPIRAPFSPGSHLLLGRCRCSAPSSPDVCRECLVRASHRIVHGIQDGLIRHLSLPRSVLSPQALCRSALQILDSKGLMTSTPQFSKSRTFRVATDKWSRRAIAAIWPSVTLIGSPSSLRSPISSP